METKQALTNEEIEHLAARFKILSETSRLLILRSLFKGERCVGEIVECTGLMQANVSKQLRILENSGILSCRPSGLQRFYSVSDPTIIEICHILCAKKT